MSQKPTSGVSLRRLRQSQGFTLIELMVVVLIIAVLIGIGIPQFLVFRSRAQDSAAMHALTVAHKTSFVVAIEQDGFPDAATLAASLPIVEPVLAWVDDVTASTGPSVVSVADDAAGTELALAARSLSGRCYYLRMSLTAGVVKQYVDNPAICRAADYRDGADTGW
jgi:prepilin-type N-terminal cleavage/methylation domain-containing protein